MKKIALILGIITGFIVGWFLCTPLRAKAEINNRILEEWAKQPSNVQWNVYYQNTNIRVVDNIPYSDPTLYDVYGLTSMYTIPYTTYVSRIDVQIKKDHESSLTHEVGHILSNAGHTLYWWITRPEYLDIWQRERYNCVALMAQGVDNPIEYFANAYDLYINFPQILKKCCPDTFNFMTVVLRNT